jgi:small neutral amino acid transporter SnatA (MarC family)
VNVWLGIAALVIAVNAPRRRAALSVDDTNVVAMGGALATIALAAIAAVATPLIDALDVSAPNLRIGTGLVLAVVSVHDLVWRPPSSGAALEGRRAAIVPVFFPVILRPEVALVALALGADHGVAVTGLAALLAMAVVTGWHALATPREQAGPFRRVERGLGLLDAGLGAAIAMAIAADGVFAI